MELSRTRIWLRIVYALVGIFVGLSVGAVFGVQFHNYHCAGWGLFSGVLAAISLCLHIYYLRGGLSDSNNSSILLRLLLAIGCVGQLAGVCGFIVYLVLGITTHQGLLISGNGFYLTMVWNFMTWKWGFLLTFYSWNYRYLVTIAEKPNQDMKSQHVVN